MHESVQITGMPLLKIKIIFGTEGLSCCQLSVHVHAPSTPPAPTQPHPFHQDPCSDLSYWPTLCLRFLDFGGNEDQGVAALAESYVGLPNMVNVMIEWLHAAGYRKREIQNLIEDHLKALIVRNFDTTKADLIFTEEVCEGWTMGGIG